MQLKADSFILLSKKIEDTIMPFLHVQKGFLNGVTSIAPERSTATEDTQWNTKQEAQDYHQTGYLEVLKTLSEVVIAEPVTSIFESSDSVFTQSRQTSENL